MQLARHVAIGLILIASAGCSTTQQVTLTNSTPGQPITTVSQVSAEGNSAQMDTHLEAALAQAGLTVKGKLPAGTTTATEVDALVSYVDVWRWDVVMYMKDLSVKVHDARTGNLLAVGTWADSALHGYRDAKLVMQGLVAEVMGKLRGGAKER